MPIITIADVVTLASIFKVGSSLGASIDEIKSALPSITKTALDLNAEITKLSSMPQLSQTLQVDLSVARDDAHPERHDISGDTLQALNITGDLYVRFNQIDSQAYNVNQARRLTIPFDTIWLSNAAQPGASATLVFGKGGQFQIQDVSPSEINIIASEVTLAISIESSTIMMPIDIQSSYIMMPIDIQAQYMDLAIDICAQTIGNIKMDMAAQSIGNVAISIAGQINDVTINICAQNIAVKGLADWGTTEGLDWNPPDTVASPGISAGNWGYTSESGNPFQVPTGKIWYVFGCSIRCYKWADGKTPLGFAVNVEAPSSHVVDLGTKLAGEGYYARFTRPIRITAGQTVRFNLLNLDATNAMGATVIVNAIQVDV